MAKSVVVTVLLLVVCALAGVFWWGLKVMQHMQRASSDNQPIDCSLFIPFCSSDIGHPSQLASWPAPCSTSALSCSSNCMILEPLLQNLLIQSHFRGSQG